MTELLILRALTPSNNNSKGVLVYSTHLFTNTDIAFSSVNNNYVITRLCEDAQRHVGVILLTSNQIQ